MTPDAGRLLRAQLGGRQSRDFAAAELGMTPTRLAQTVNRLIDDPAVHARFPVEVARLRRLRDQGRRRRSAVQVG